MYRWVRRNGIHPNFVFGVVLRHGFGQQGHAPFGGHVSSDIGSDVVRPGLRGGVDNGAAALDHM